MTLHHFVINKLKFRNEGSRNEKLREKFQLVCLWQFRSSRRVKRLQFHPLLELFLFCFNDISSCIN